MTKKCILVVDDNEFDRKVLVKVLLKKGDYIVLQADRAESCLKMLESEKIDLILMDIMMPGKFGTQVLKEIREKSNPIELPIIMITSKTEIKDIVNALELGANDYIVKPISFKVAITRIGVHLKLAELSQEMAKLKEIAAIHAMVTTYNHEINNPLSIALGCLASPKWSGDGALSEKLKSALWRVADIVKKIEGVTEKEAEYENYDALTRMVKLNKK